MGQLDTFPTDEVISRNARLPIDVVATEELRTKGQQENMSLQDGLRRVAGFRTMIFLTAESEEEIK